MSLPNYLGLSLLLDATSNTSTARPTSTPSAFDVYYIKRAIHVPTYLVAYSFHHNWHRDKLNVLVFVLVNVVTSSLFCMFSNHFVFIISPTYYTSNRFSKVNARMQHKILTKSTRLGHIFIYRIRSSEFLFYFIRLY